MSIAAFAVAAGAIAWVVLALTESSIAATSAAAVFARNPNVLYLQTTPMTEALLLALATLGVAMLLAWAHGEMSAPGVGWAFALACLTRYHAWPGTACALAAAMWTCWRQGDTAMLAWRRVRPSAGVNDYPPPERPSTPVRLLARGVLERAEKRRSGEWN